MPLPRGCITGAEGCVLVVVMVDAVGVGPPRKPIAIIMRNCTVYAFTLAPSGHLTDTTRREMHMIFTFNHVGHQHFRDYLQSFNGPAMTNTAKFN